MVPKPALAALAMVRLPEMELMVFTQSLTTEQLPAPGSVRICAAARLATTVLGRSFLRPLRTPLITLSGPELGSQELLCRLISSGTSENVPPRKPKLY